MKAEAFTTDLLSRCSTRRRQLYFCWIEAKVANPTEEWLEVLGQMGQGASGLPAGCDVDLEI